MKMIKTRSEWLLAAVLAFVACTAFANFAFTDNFGNEVVVARVSPNSVYSDGDNNEIVMAKSDTYQNEGRCKYGYQFNQSTVVVYVYGSGVSTTSEGVRIRVNKVAVTYNQSTTEIMSVSWSDQKDAYLITFREDGVVHAEWLDFNSPLFREILRLENAGPGATVASSREEMGEGFEVLANNTTGVTFIPEKR